MSISSQLNGKIKFMFQTTKQERSALFSLKKFHECVSSEMMMEKTKTTCFISADGHKNLVPSGNFLWLAIENGPVEIVSLVSFPNKHKVIFPVRSVSHYQRVPLLLTSKSLAG